jgi:hypothetical protein
VTGSCENNNALSAGQKMSGAVSPLLRYAFMDWYEVKKAQGQLYLTFTLPGPVKFGEFLDWLID